MSADKYPLPAYACSIWAAGDNLMVAFPGVATEQSHTIKLPLSVAGLQTVLSILRERSTAQDLRLSKFGTPSQWEVENDARYKALIRARADDAKATREEKAEAAEFLKELGL